MTFKGFVLRLLFFFLNTNYRLALHLGIPQHGTNWKFFNNWWSLLCKTPAFPQIRQLKVMKYILDNPYVNFAKLGY